MTVRWFGVMVAAAAIGSGVAGCGAGAGRRASGVASSFGHMAGSVWGGPVRSVGAMWAVPRMLGAGEAHASTWIGTQAPGIARSSPFIQVGTVEDRDAGGRAVYAAFWTDTTRGFHPQILFRVSPGDLISTRLSRAGHRWEVRIVDGTTSRQSSFTTAEEGAGAFNLAEWLQEDPSEDSGRVTPYPRLSTVWMRSLAVDGGAPRYGNVYAQWMSLPAGELAPSVLRGDGFSITRGVLTRAGRRYLAIARPQNLAAATVDREAAGWTAQTPASEIERVSATAGASERGYADALAHASWPAAARGAIRALVREVRVEAGVFATAARHTSGGVDQWRAAVVRVAPVLQSLSHRVRRALRLPELAIGQALSAATA
jgi:hypothetical protein